MFKKLFAEDEMKIPTFNPKWTTDELLGQEGIFFLKDVIKILGMDPGKIKKKAKTLEARGKNTYREMGVRKMWNHWVVRMKVFAPYFREHLIPLTRAIDPEWDGNTLLAQKGRFLLTEVAAMIPFSTHQLRYQAKKIANARQTMGVWKDETMNLFLVDMEKFAPYIEKLWRDEDAPS